MWGAYVYKQFMIGGITQVLDKWDDKEIACEAHLLKMNKYMIKRKMDPQDFSRSKKVIRHLIDRGFDTYGELPWNQHTSIHAIFNVWQKSI